MTLYKSSFRIIKYQKYARALYMRMRGIKTAVSLGGNTSEKQRGYMKKKLLVTALMILSIACLLVACNNSTNYDGLTKITFEPEGGVYQNCTLPFYQYYDFKDGTTNLIREPLALSRKEFKKDGYTFVGWFKTRTEVDGKVTYSDMWDFATDKVGTDGVTLYAGWKRNVTYLYNVCYVDEQGQTQIIGSYDVSEGDEFDDYENYAAKRSGYTALAFADEDTGYMDDGYYLDAECAQPVKGYKHPGGEEDTAINVYVKYVKGEYTLVRTASELIAARSNDIYLLADVDMKGATLSFENYGGVFEGNGHTISNFTIAYNAGNNDLKFNFDDNSGDTAVHASLFESLSGATLRNVKFSGATFTVDGGTSKIKKIYFAPLCMSATDSKIENVSIEVSYKIVSGPVNNKDFDFASDFKAFEQGYRTAENTTIVDFDVTMTEAK